MSSKSTGDVEMLRHKVQGRVMLPGDEGYDSARALWNAMVDRRPAVAVQCTSSADGPSRCAGGRGNGIASLAVHAESDEVRDAVRS